MYTTTYRFQHQEGEGACPECGKVVRHLALHIRRRHRPVAKVVRQSGLVRLSSQLPCDITVVSMCTCIVYSYVLFYHQDGNEPVACPECGKMLGDQSALTRHMKRQHPPVAKVSGIQCNHFFSTSQQYNILKFIYLTTEIFTFLQIYKCHNCDLTFNSDFMRDKHSYDDHNVARPYQCDTCGAGFLRTHHLKTHQLIHVKRDEDGEKFTCPDCDYKVFHCQRDLTLHIKRQHSVVGKVGCLHSVVRSTQWLYHHYLCFDFPSYVDYGPTENS